MTWMMAEKSHQYSYASSITEGEGLNVRIPDGFLPKYRFWYHVRGPLTVGSGAAPLGSFS